MATPYPSVHSLIKKYNILPKKRLGQNFLIERKMIEKIVSAMELCDSDVVLEIGPGFGFMTSLMAEKARHVFAVEKDPRLLEVALAEFGHIKNITWAEGDILKQDLGGMPGGRMKIAGNLPYNISSPVMFWMLDNRELISQAVIMVQKEVAERVSSGPDSRDYGILSVLVQARAECRKLFDVSPNNFFPPPDVWSSIMKFDLEKGPVYDVDDGELKRVVKAAFGMRRKTLFNSLCRSRTLGLAPQRIAEALKLCGIDGKRRSETLSVSEFVALTNALLK